ncbi:hypothetical protein ACWCYZ_06260 [Streptomyces virginiae]
MGSLLHRSTDWDQQADRHTPLRDPVVTVRQLGRLGLTGSSPTRIDHTLVYTTRQGSFEVFLPPHRPRRVPRRYTAVYEVDMGVHAVRTLIRLPGIDDAHEFEASVELDWQVSDPARFVRSGHRDVPRLLLSQLEQAARPITRRFPIADSAEAEAEVLAEQGGARADLEKAVRARTQHQHRLDLQGYEAQRIDFYREYLTRGGIDAWAMHLTQHPQDSAKAMSSLREEQRERLQAQMALIKEMLTKAGTEPFELEGPRRLAIEAFSAVFGRHVPVEEGSGKTVAEQATESRTEPDLPYLPPQPAAVDTPAWQPVVPPDTTAPEEHR